MFKQVNTAVLPPADVQVIKATLDLHNKHRLNHKVGPLVWDDECYRHAKTWADELTKSMTIKHGGKPESMGQNIYWASATEGVEEAVHSWMVEGQYYDYSKGEYSPKVGHFTQCVWKGAQKIGLAVTYSQGGGTMVVANYFPRGNVRGLFCENVFPPLQAVKYAPAQDSITTMPTGNVNSIGATSTSTKIKTMIVNGKKTVVKTTTTTMPDGTQKVTVDPPEAAGQEDAKSSSTSTTSPAVTASTSAKEFGSLSVAGGGNGGKVATGGTTKTSISKKTTITNGVKKVTITKKKTHPDGSVTEEVSYE